MQTRIDRLSSRRKNKPKPPLLKSFTEEVFIWPDSISWVSIGLFYRLDYYSLSYRNENQYFGIVFE